MTEWGDVSIAGAGVAIAAAIAKLAGVLGPLAKHMVAWAAKVEADVRTAAAAATDVAEIRARLEERDVIPLRREKGAR